MINVLVLIHKRENQSDPRLARFMFHKIYWMYSGIKNREENNTDMLLTSISEYKEAKKVNEELEESCDNYDNNQPILQENIIPSNINDIQPRATQVWNCNSFGFVPNVRWINIICTYKLFQGEKMWKVKTGEQSPLWCTLLVFTQSGGKCLIPPIIVHQAKYYS